MADLALTASKIAPIFPDKADIFSMICGVTITAGQAVYVASTALVGLADANAAGKEQFKGIALEGGGAGQAIDVLKEGHIAGFTVSQAHDTPLFLSDTAGAIADAASGTKTVPVGRVVAMTDSNLTKVVYIDAQWAIQY